MRKRDTASGDLFDQIPRPAPAVPASMDYRARVSALVADMLAAAHTAGLDRYAVAAQCSRLAGREVSKAMLDGYTAESRDTFNVPLWLAPVLETACQRNDLSEWLASVRGGRIVWGAETLDTEIGRIEGEREALANQLRELRDLRRRVR
ncbi:MAG: hypothetical protein Q8L45_01565 [Xanthomonadaceae bacterium]|nr:hypothetical protein [Xanthomonadaceae bacterium]MDP2185052.1 hypothetical protein [Xanthomonadales bacterium]MDZ4114431.1 hypothetical protein [Xanthomonadaceae bacterium]